MITIKVSFKRIKKNNTVLALPLLFLLVITQSLSAQSKTEVDTVSYHKVLLLPYNPKYYLSDADRDIAAQSNESPQAFRKKFNEESDRKVFIEVSKTATCVSLFEDTSAALIEDVSTMLAQTAFQYDTPTLKEKVSLKKKVFKSDPNKDARDSRTSTQYINEEQDVKYMRAVVTKPELLTALAAKYHFDLFVFITQMEFKTNYSSCTDLANKIYKREIMLHFTVYDKDGKLIAGNFAKTFFPSNENAVNGIISNQFPQLAQGIVESFTK
jgi:hypothetical protein